MAASPILPVIVRGIAFDGRNIWVAGGSGFNTVTMLSSVNGNLVGSFAVGPNPWGVVFDGANIWVTNADSNSVSKLRASDGATLGTFVIGNGPKGIVFDGTDLWIAASGDNHPPPPNLGI